MTPQTKFDLEARDRFILVTRAGASMEEACELVGVSLRTVQRLTAAGKRRADAESSAFAAALASARTEAAERADAPEVEQGAMDDDEFRACLEKAIRRGSTQAMRLWSERFASRPPSRPPLLPDPFDQLDAESLPATNGRG
jgi:hypothetical protein